MKGNVVVSRLIHMVARSRVAESIVDDGSDDLVVAVNCQDDQHFVRLTPRGRLSFDQHRDLQTLFDAAEAAALARMPETIRCGEILLVWRHWTKLAEKFPGASRHYGVPEVLQSRRQKGERLRCKRAEWVESEAKRIRREHIAFMNRVYHRVRVKRGKTTAYDLPQYLPPKPKMVLP